MTAAEWKWAVIASILVMALTSLPYVGGYAAETSELVFRGAVYNYLDYFHHLGDLNQGLRGASSYQFLTTAEPHPAAFIRLPHLALGHIARLLNLSPPVIYHAARLAFGLAALLAMYRFAAIQLRPIPLRRTAFALFALGSGVGWLLILLDSVPNPAISPIDFWLIDPYGFFSLHTFAHFAMALWLLLSIMIRLSQFLDFRRWTDLALGLLAGLGLGLVQPTAPIIALAAFATYVVWRSLAARRLDRMGAGSVLLLGLTQVPVLVYSLQVFRGHRVWQAFLEQNITLSPPPIYYLLGFGLLTPLALWGTYLTFIRARIGTWRLSASWVAAALVLAYFPVAFQRRLTLGVMAPLAALATIAIGYGLLPRLRGLRGRPFPASEWRRGRFAVLATLIVLTAVSSLTLVLAGTGSTLTRQAELYVPSDLSRTAAWLQGNHAWSDPIFASERTGRFIVSQIGHRVQLAHPVETVDYDRKLAETMAFYSAGTPDAERRAALNACSCDVLVYGPYEWQLGEWDPSTADFLEQVHREGQVMVFRVKG